MAKKLIVTLVALMGVIAMVLAGCTGPVEPTGDTVNVHFLIRTEDEREDMGDYMSDQLEDLGFTVTRQYGVSGDLSPIWRGDPSLGLWNCYTGGWLSTAVSRDDGGNFGAFYTPLWSAMGPLHAAYTPTEEFLEAATALWNNDFDSMDERRDLFEICMPASLEDSVRVWLVDRAGFSPLRNDVHLAADSAGGIYGSWMWAPTVHFRDGSGIPLLPAWDGGTSGSLDLRVSTVDLFIDPWNPVSGSNWAYDHFPQNAMTDMGAGIDVNDGLRWPYRIDHVDMWVLDSLPIGLTTGHETWLTLDTVTEEIAVPGTAWADWDADAEDWIDASTRFGGNETCLVKTVVYYDDTLFDIPYHDGSLMSEGDFLVRAIMEFARAKPTCEIYDPDYVAEFNAFMQHFKGVEFDFTQPGYDLVVTTYDDLWTMDAEIIVTGAGLGFPSGVTWYPISQYGQYAWHDVALGYLADRDLEVCFSDNKATAEEVDWMSFIAGPSLTFLADHLTDVQNVADPDYRFLPFSNVLSTYVDNTEIDTRYGNLATFYGTYGHFYVGTGPYVLVDLDTTAEIIELAAWQNFDEDGSKFFYLMDPAPTTPPAHTGPWCDLITITVDTDAEAVGKLSADELDVFAFAIVDADLLADVQADSNLWYYQSIGSFNECTLNPVGPFFPGTGELNPMHFPAIREALNWAFDRSYIVGTIMGGLGFERISCLDTAGGDAVNRYPDLIAAAEAAYAYDFDAADEAIEAAMLAIEGVYRDETTDKYMYLAP